MFHGKEWYWFIHCIILCVALEIDLSWGSLWIWSEFCVFGMYWIESISVNLFSSLFNSRFIHSTFREDDKTATAFKKVPFFGIPKNIGFSWIESRSYWFSPGKGSSIELVRSWGFYCSVSPAVSVQLLLSSGVEYHSLTMGLFPWERLISCFVVLFLLIVFDCSSAVDWNLLSWRELL